MSALRETGAWKALQAHYEQVKGRHLRELFAEDAKRGERLAVEFQRIGELDTVRWLVLLSFAWLGTLVFYEVDYALNVVFDSTWKRHPLISSAIAVASQGAVGILLILSYVATETVNLLTAYAPHLWGLDLIALAAHDGRGNRG